MHAQVVNKQSLMSDKPISIILESKIDYDMFTADNDDFDNDEFGSLEDPEVLTRYLKMELDIKLTEQQVQQLASAGELTLYLNVDSLPNNVEYGYLDMYFKSDNYDIQKEQSYELKTESDV